MNKLKLPNNDEKVSQLGLFSDRAREQKAALLDKLLAVTDVNKPWQDEVFRASLSGEVLGPFPIKEQLLRLLSEKPLKKEDISTPPSTPRR